MPERKSTRTDVLIVGSGAVGVAAGLEAQEAGAQVVVIEKEAHLGGAAAISGGGCSCVGTLLQREHGIEDSPDLAFDDWITWGGGDADEAWTRFYIEHSNADLYQWGIERGVQWDALTQQEGNSVPRWHRPAGGGGGLWNALYQHALARGLTDWVTCMPAHDLIVDNGRVAGVVAVHRHRRRPGARPCMPSSTQGAEEDRGAALLRPALRAAGPQELWRRQNQPALPGAG